MLKTLKLKCGLKSSTGPQKILPPDVPVVGQGGIQATCRDGFKTGSREELFLSGKDKAGMVNEWAQGLGWAQESQQRQVKSHVCLYLGQAPFGFPSPTSCPFLSPDLSLIDHSMSEKERLQTPIIPPPPPFYSPTPSDPMDCSPPGSSVHGILQARVLEWGAIAFSANFIRDAVEGKGLILG